MVIIIIIEYHNWFCFISIAAAKTISHFMNVEQINVLGVYIILQGIIIYCIEPQMCKQFQLINSSFNNTLTCYLISSSHLAPNIYMQESKQAPLIH